MKRSPSLPPIPPEVLQRACELTGRKQWTIRQWYAKGCDVANEEMLAQWAEGKKHSKKPRKKQKEVSLGILDSLPVAGSEGAAAALKRLQGLELTFYARLLDALKENDQTTIGISSREYSLVTESLRKYEKEVELARRDLGHLIPKQEAVNGARSAALWFRLAWRLWLSSAVPDLLPLADDPRAFKAKAEQTFSEILAVSLKNGSEAKLAIPTWADAAIKEEFHSA